MHYLSLTEPLTPAILADLLGSKEAVRLSPATEQQLATHQEAVPQGEPLPSSLPPGAAAQDTAGLLLAYAAGTGPEVPAALVRRMLLLKACQLGTDSRTRLPTVRRLLDFYNRDVWPVVYEKGALGPDGDQIPLAHLTLPLLGLGEVNYQGYRLAASDMLSLFSWEPLALSAAEGLALLSGNQFGLAYATEALERTEHLGRAAQAIGALTAAVYGAALPGLLEPTGPDKPKQLTTSTTGRLAPTASRKALAQARQAVEIACEFGSGWRHFLSVEDLLEAAPIGAAAPLPVALLAQATAAAGSQSALRMVHLVAGQQGLPQHLAAAPALGGLRALPVAAASLVNHNQQLGALAAPLATDTRRVVENAEQLLGLELLAAAQAHDLREQAGQDLGRLGSAALTRAVAAFREHVTFAAHDRVLAPDLHRAARFVREYAWA